MSTNNIINNCQTMVVYKDPKIKCNCVNNYDNNIRTINKTHDNIYAHGGTAYLNHSSKTYLKNNYNSLIFNNTRCITYKPSNKSFSSTGAVHSGAKIAQAKYNALTRAKLTQPYFNFF
jgi:hypothetical protein